MNRFKLFSFVVFLISPQSNGQNPSVAEISALWKMEDPLPTQAKAFECRNELGGHEVIDRIRRDACIGFADVEDLVIVGKFIPELGRCLIWRDGTEMNLKWCKYVLPSKGHVQWVGATSASLPGDMVPIKEGSDVYACRIAHRHNLLIGTWKQGSANCTVAYRDKELSSPNFEIRARSKLSLLIQRLQVQPTLAV